MKKFLIVVAVLVALGGGVFYYLHKNKLKDFEPQIKEKLNKLVMDASNGLYHLEIEKLETDVATSSILLVNAHLRPDTLRYAELEKMKLAPDDMFDVTVRELSIENVVPAEFLANRAINLHRLYINKPVVTVAHKKQAYNLPDKDSSKSVYDRIKKDISSIQVDTIILQNIDFTYKNKMVKDKVTRLSNVKIYFNDLLIDSSTQYDQNRFLFARNCVISLKDYTLKTPDSLYKFTIGDLEIETVKKAMLLKKLQFVPRVAANEYYKRLKHQQDRFEVNMDQVSFTNVNWWAILGEESFIVNRVAMRKGVIKVYNDKSQPLDTRSKVGKYPHQLLMKVPFLLNVDTMTVSNIDLSYTELNPKSNEKGTLYFDDIQGTLTNITNDPEAIKKNHFIKIAANGRFMKKSPVTATFLMDLAKYKTGNFSVTASLGAMDAAAINPITIPLGMLKVNSLNIKSLDATMKGDNYHGTGTVKMIYNDLNVTALKSTGDTLKKRGLISFVANAFVIKKENPFKNQAVRVETGSFDRDVNRSFFNLVWKTIFTGAGKTAGYKVKK